MSSATRVGSMFVVETECQLAADKSSGLITIESTRDEFPRAIEELSSIEARHMALAYAGSQGMPDPRINGIASGAYPINSEGKPLDKVLSPDGQTMPPTHPLMQPFAYRIDIPVCRKLV